MANRISKKQVHFLNPFKLESFDETWPAGSYTIESELESLDSLSHLATRIVATTMVVRVGGKSAETRFVEIDSQELEAALVRDQAGIDRAENEGLAT